MSSERETTQSAVVRTERRGHALWVRIDRPDRRNALNTEVLREIGRAVAGANGDPGTRAIVLTGTGDRAFCAGADLTDGPAVFAGYSEPTTDFGALARQVNGSRLPLIARVNGACVAGGMGLLGLCDLAIAADHAKFGLPEVRVGVFPMQVLVYLRTMLSARHVNELCLTGELIGAPRALEIGLVNSVVAPGDLDASVDDLVRRISLGSPAAIHRGRHVIAAMGSMDFAGALAFAEAQIAAAAQTPDAAEGLAAFNSKRLPDWAPQTKGESDV